jgi:uncharacterized YigZ family protein
MNRYRTVQREAEAEQTIDKSRFIAYVKPVETKEEADAYIAVVRLKNKEATHNVPAIVIGEKFQIQWASDDGEPQGPSGAPIVPMLVKEHITNVVIVVTRYYGGIKLGTGGLVRAYTGSAKLGLAAAGICRVKDMTLLTVKLEYTYLNKIQNISKIEKFEIKEIFYEDMVTLRIAAEPENIDYIKTLLLNISAGNCMIISELEELIKIAE